MSASAAEQATITPGRLCQFGLLTLALALCFGLPLHGLAAFAWHSEIYSYILLVPFISGYLIWARHRIGWWSVELGRSAWVLLPLVCGLGLLAGYRLALSGGWAPCTEDYLAVMTSSFLCLGLSGAIATLGLETLKRFAFPAGLLFCMVPLPGVVLHSLESFLQHGSADVAYAFFTLSGVPIIREETLFRLPGIALEVAPECSGIHSTLALLIASLVAGCLLLKNPWWRAVLAVAVVPLALLRNGFRIFTIGQLCIHFGPAMLNSYIHHRGGPIFFVLSLIPLFLLLAFLRKFDHRCSGAAE